MLKAEKGLSKARGKTDFIAEQQSNKGQGNEKLPFKKLPFYLNEENKRIINFSK